MFFFNFLFRGIAFFTVSSKSRIRKGNKVEAKNFVPKLWVPRTNGAIGATGYLREKEDVH